MIWIEVLSRYHDVIARHRCDGDAVTLGRAYDNDVVLDDPFVAAHHVRIGRDEDGRIVAEDLGTTNGLHTDEGDQRQDVIVLDGDRIVRVGKTLLRVRTPDYAVAAERRAVAATRIGPLVLALAVVVIGVAVLSLWLSETEQPELSHYLLPVMGMVLIVLIWTTGWAVMSRIFAGHLHFQRHLLIALSGLLALFVFDEITDYGAFAFSAGWLANYAYVAAWLLLGALIYFHVREIAPRHPVRKIAVVSGLAIAAIAAQTVAKSDQLVRFGQQSYLPALKPPAFRLKRPLEEDAFFTSVDRVKDAVDQARREPPTGRSLLDFDNSDE
ncbi:MAG TPA: FHA domain-containing protein [Casimicrobiaceae bacterium]|nr:FHA domain-containing protein [Casimicrobiaceae bacterium]